ncbi:hypothetical protein NC653_023162 [Populus alba x Populus x berolinensis]|uniref:Uncharacterized protein n=1 Tax=Populus alba x Populus x berolinensis TaxID=444605 RepID=A0AAD6MGV4_9ROSI|nr:hypothetical protein NC653_023162 [Populus alba x Populus x berolinensis]
MEGWRLSEEHWQGHVKFLYFAGFEHKTFTTKFNQWGNVGQN